MLPSINISFREAGITAIKRGQRGIVVLILEDDAGIEPTTVLTPADIPKELTAENKKQVELSLIGYVTPPRKVIVCVVPDALVGEADYTDIQNYLETIRWDYVAIPQIKSTQTSAFATWIKALRDTKKKRVKAVLPNTPADHEGVINFTTGTIETKEKIYTNAEYCSRIAGLIAGTPLTIAGTFAPLPEVIDCEKKTIEELGAAIGKGEFVLYNDGEKIKVGRGVNSLVTTTEGKQDSFKKIKIIEAMDLIYDDIKKTAEDNYLGKYSNSYDNKCLLIMAILGYLEGLEIDGILSKGKTTVVINIEKQANYLKSKGIDTEGMSELEIKKADTGDKVFLGGSLKILDAIEEIDLDLDI